MAKTKKVTQTNKTRKVLIELNKEGKKVHGKYLAADIAAYEAKEHKPILYVRNLTKRYFGRKTPAIQGINFQVYPGEFHAFIGANGAGKTTTIKTIIGAYSQWSGTVLINGMKNNMQQAKQKLGYIPETTRFPEKFSSFQYLVWMVMLSGFKHKDAKIVAEQKLKEFNMWSLRHKSPNGFSSGQKKKILLAQALIHDPDIIVMDEPVANLDPKARAEFFSTLAQLKKRGKAIFVSSHVLAELDIYFDSATILDGGRIVFSGNKAKLAELYTEQTYSCEISKPEIVDKWLDAHKLSYTKQGHTQIIKTTDEKLIEKLQKYIISKNLLIINFTKNLPTLEQVYRKLIVKGSVDTMNGKENAEVAGKEIKLV